MDWSSQRDSKHSNSFLLTKQITLSKNLWRSHSERCYVINSYVRRVGEISEDLIQEGVLIRTPDNDTPTNLILHLKPLLRLIIFSIEQKNLVGQDLLIIEASPSHSDTRRSVGLLWKGDQPVAETFIWQHTTLTTDRQPCPQWDTNPQSEQTSDLRPTP
jgi:hypothetical protein